MFCYKNSLHIFIWDMGFEIVDVMKVTYSGIIYLTFEKFYVLFMRLKIIFDVLNF